VNQHRVVVLGAGIGGMATAVRLHRAGIDDFVILERGDGVGGTWRWNTYPGAACDVPSHLYSFSFAPNPDWTSTFARQPEILAYLERVADDFGLRPHLRFGRTVTAMRWDDSSSTWTVETDEGETYEAGVVISALGTFTEPKLPAIDGLDDFAGRLLHSARWDHGIDLAGQRVGVIGTGASAIQIIPTIAPAAGHTTVFQRTAAWIVPRKDPPYTAEEQAVFRATPRLARRHRGDIYRAYEERTSFEVDSPVEAALEAFALDYLAAKVADPELRAKLTPNYRIGCKRVLPSSDYLPAMQRDDVTLVTDGIVRVLPAGVETADGTVHELDVLVAATGFDATGWLKGIDVVGRGGRSLRQAWSAGARAHLGITVSGFPNLFLLYGPNTNQPGNSIIFILEAQAAYAVRALRAMDRAGATSVEVRPEVQEAYVAAIDEAMQGTVWQSGCASYFHDEHGRVATQLPHPSRWYWRRTLQFHPEEHLLR
jgi:cation diffusion facilitator CzcD-associated flavoprotein CzcO